MKKRNASRHSPTSAQIHAEEVAGWFRDSGIKRRPLPSTEQVAPIVKTLQAFVLDEEEMRSLFPHAELKRELVGAVQRASPEVAGARTALLKVLALADTISDQKERDFLLWPGTRDLVAVLDSFLSRHPPRRKGHPGDPPWKLVARVFARDVVKVLIAAGWPEASATSDDGAVAFVVSRMVDAIGIEGVKPATIARHLRSIKPGPGEFWP